MSDHLPECIYEPRNVDPDKGIEWGGSPCICYWLRACEQRIARLPDHEAIYADGYAAGLDAAREAVERVSSLFQPLGPALAAIDALKEKP